MVAGFSLSASSAGIAPASLTLGALFDSWVTIVSAIFVGLVLVGLLVSFAAGRRNRGERVGRSIEQSPMPAAEQRKEAPPLDAVERAREAAPPPAGEPAPPPPPAEEAERSPWLPLGSGSASRRETDADAPPAAGQPEGTASAGDAPGDGSSWEDDTWAARSPSPGAAPEPAAPPVPQPAPQPEPPGAPPQYEPAVPASPPRSPAPPPVVSGLPPEPAGTDRRDGTVEGAVEDAVEDADEAQSTLPPLRFTALHPREAPVATWQTLLVYTYVASAAEAVLADAAKFQDELGARPREVHAMAARSVERGTQLTIVPSCEGVRFNPERVSFTWDEDVQRSYFRFEAAPELAGSAGNGEITVYVGPLIVSTLKFSLLFDQAQASPDVSLPTVQTTGQLFEAIFASYSHDDSSVVLACRNAYKALGLSVNIDIDSLRSGDHYDTRLLQLIDSSDIFQLFWSEHSAQSDYVRKEWSYALEHSKGPGFIRPVYWQQPLVPPPPELGDLHFTYIELPALSAGSGDN